MKKIDCFIRGETNKAFYLEFGVGKKEWLPKKCVVVGRGAGTMGRCDLAMVPEWLLRARKIS